METRANHVWVGVVTLALLALVAGSAIWVARLGLGHQRLYDIYFRQSVDGLGKGSEITYAGVPAGQVKTIELWKKDPGFVRVRIAINDRIPILQGTTATIQSGFTGVSAIQLNGGVKGAAPITEPGPDGMPVIPTQRSGLGALLSNAPLLLERLTTLTEKLTNLMSDQNQRAVTSILANTNRLTGNLADASPQVKQTLGELHTTLAQATLTLAEFQKVAGTANNALDENGSSLARQLHDTLKSAKGAADSLQATLADARPAARQLSQSTLPDAEAAIRDLRATTKALREVTEKIDNQGVGAMIGSPKLPDYKP
jgi:phospholipid/cholesterol/gamma-HCH transport system substrate-binding protein